MNSNKLRILLMLLLGAILTVCMCACKKEQSGRCECQEMGTTRTYDNVTREQCVILDRNLRAIDPDGYCIYDGR